MTIATGPADKVERRRVSELIPYDRNAKLHPDSQIEQLASSIREWGWTIPILIDEGGNVIAGHGRLFAAKLLGIETVPCVVAKNWTDEQKKAYTIADNKLAENAEWDTGQYFAELKGLHDIGFDLSKMGIDSDMSFLSFSPELNPGSEIVDVNEQDVLAAQAEQEQKMATLNQSRAQNSIELVCPHCAKSFSFTP